MNLRDSIPKTWTKDLSDVFDEANGAKQTSRVQMNCTYAICKDIAEFGGKNGILIHLCPSTDGAQATTIAASATGEMVMNTHWSQYWFVTGVNIEITIDSDSQSAGMHLGYDGPATTQNKHAINSSISFNAGAFGDTPTAGASTSSSFSTTIDDFKVKNNSDFAAGTLNHDYLMAATAGGEFDPKGGGINWSSLVLGGWDFLVHHDSVGGLFGGVISHPYQPPDAAVSNLPIASQGLWIVPTDYKGKTIFTVKFKLLYLAAHANAAGPHVKHDHAEFSADFAIDWSQV